MRPPRSWPDVRWVVQPPNLKHIYNTALATTKYDKHLRKDTKKKKIRFLVRTPPINDRLHSPPLFITVLAEHQNNPLLVKMERVPRTTVIAFFRCADWSPEKKSI